MKVIIQYSIADLRHVCAHETSGILNYWYRTSHKPPLCFLRNSGSYCGSIDKKFGCYYNANRAVKINGWRRFVDEQAQKGIAIELDHRLLYLNRVYATAIYEICFDISLPEKIDFIYILDELSKLQVRISKSFEEVGNDYLKKDFINREYLTTLLRAKQQITNHYASITTKKEALMYCGKNIYKSIKCSHPTLYVLLGKSEFIHFKEENIEKDLEGKEEIIILNRNDKKGVYYDGYIFVNTKWEDSHINTYSNFSEAVSIKSTLDEVLYQIDEGQIRPSQKSDVAQHLQGFLKNCLSHFRKEESFISDQRLRDLIYSNPVVLERNFNFENLKTQIKEVINIRPNLFKIVETYLNDIEAMSTKQGNNITINNNSTGTVLVGDNNHSITNIGLQNFNDEVDKLLSQLHKDDDDRLDDIKADINALKSALQSKDEKKAQARYEKIKTYGGLVLDFAKTIATYISLI